MADRVRCGAVLFAVVTPLASIFGSGFLIITPVLERALGAWSVFGVVLVCVLAWFLGTAIRHCVRVVEPLTKKGLLDQTTARLEKASDVVIVVAYIISVALYLRIMAEYIVTFVQPAGSPLAERLIACAAVVLILLIGVFRGFKGLGALDRIALGLVLVLVTVLGGVLLVHDIGLIQEGTLGLPPVPDVSFGHILLVLGGIVITIQGFETVRYLGHAYDGPTRIWASRLAQIIAAVVYLGFVAVATPVMGLGTPDGPDGTLLAITLRVSPVLTLPLVLAGVFSQLSAAIADTAAADGNLRGLSRWMIDPRPYLLTGITAIVLSATMPTLVIVTVASRAFAAYYGLQCLVAFRTSSGAGRRLGYGGLAVIMFAVAVLALPAG